MYKITLCQVQLGGEIRNPDLEAHIAELKQAICVAASRV